MGRGKGEESVEIKFAKRCASRWFTGTIGLLKAYESVFMVSVPVKSDPISPGP